MDNDTNVNGSASQPKSFTGAIKAAKARAAAAQTVRPEDEELDFGLKPVSEDPDGPKSKLREVLDQLAAERAAKAAQEAASRPLTLDELVAQGKLLPVTGLEDLVSDMGSISDYGRQVDEACTTITLKEVYDKLPKRKYSPGHEHRSGEGVEISCPNDQHADSNPSAWMNTEKPNKKGEPGGEYCCGGCQEGGDKYVVAGFLYGKMNFNALKERMAHDFRGVTKPEPVTTAPATMPVAPVVVAVATSEPVTPDIDPGTVEDDVVDEVLYPEYDLKAVLPDTNTFLDAYCAESLKADIPREFPLWVGLSVLSVALGRNASLLHIEQPTYSNLSVCLTAKTAAGKGRSAMQGQSVLRNAVPYDDTPLLSGLDPEGVRIVRLPGSGEALISELDIMYEVRKDEYKHFAPPALVEFEEMQMLLSKAGPTASFKDVILQFADARSWIERSSLKNGKGVVRDSFVTFLTATQPERLREQFSKGDESRGLLNRFIFPFGKAVPRRAWGQPDMDWLMPTMLLTVIHNWVKDGKHYARTDWDDDARDYWIAEHAARIQPDSSGVHANLLGRLELMTLKMILLFACNERSDRIKLGHVKSAFALYDYMKNCQLVLAREMAATEMSEGMKALLDAVERCEDKLKKPPTRRELDKISALIKEMNEEQFTNTLGRLISSRRLFHVHTKSKTGRGRTGTCYTTNISQWETHATLAVTAAAKP